MVFSRLNPDIEYMDKRILEERDKNLDTILYEIVIKKYMINILIALGKETIINDILYFPIYLINVDKFVSQIGIFEYQLTLNNKNENENENEYGLYNKDGRIKIEKLGDPLLYSFATKDYLMSYQVMKYINNKPLWIQTFMHDNKYDLIDTESNCYGGNSECLYTALKIGLSDIRKFVSITSMKLIIIKNVTQKVFHYYKNQHDNNINKIQHIKSEIKTLQEKNKIIENKIKNTLSRNEKLVYVNDAEYNIEYFNKKKKELVYVTKKYKNNSFMNGINTIQQFKEIIQTNTYKPDKWVISVLERELNIKIVLFSEDEYEYNDLFNVINCDVCDVCDYDIENKVFNPEYYILISYSKKSYQLISYNHRCIFTFKQLDSTIKNMIVDKIQERNAGIYAELPDFKNYMKANNIVLKNKSDLTIQSDLYSGDTLFQIYNFSNDEYEPGYGIGENIDKRELENYNNLLYYSSWRRQLYNVYKYNVDKYDDNEIYKKISLNKELKTILMNTKNAKIVYFKPKYPPVPAIKLMKIRKMMIDNA